MRLRDLCFAKIRSLTDDLEGAQANIQETQAEAAELHSQLEIAAREAEESEVLAKGLELSLHATWEAKAQLEDRAQGLEMDLSASETATAIAVSVVRDLAVRVQELEVRSSPIRSLFLHFLASHH